MQILKMGYARPILVILIAAVLTLLQPATANACGLLELSCVFGWTDRTEIREREATERAQIEAQRAREAAEQERMKEADIAEQQRLQAVEVAEQNRLKEEEVARVKAEADRQQREHEAQLEAQRQAGLLSQKQVEEQAISFRKLVDQQANLKLQEIEANYNLMSGALTLQSQIAQAGIAEQGLTAREQVLNERAKIWSDGGLGMVALVVGGIIVIVFLRNRQPAYRVLPPPNAYPQFPQYPQHPALPRQQHELPNRQQLGMNGQRAEIVPMEGWNDYDQQ